MENTMSLQMLFNIIAGVCGTLGMFILRAMWDGLSELRKSDAEIAKEVAEIKILVAGQYVTRDELKGVNEAIFAKLDNITDLLHKKADRPHGQ